jgi:hypothetical protein
MKWSFNRIRAALINIENERSYYAGASLCIDFIDHPNVVLNLNGRGFFYGFKNSNKQMKFVVPNDIKDKILDIYKKYKIHGY